MNDTKLKINTRLLTEVMVSIEAEAKRAKSTRRWNQSVWREFKERFNRSTKSYEPSCNTAMCLAGWTVELDPKSRWAITPEMVLENRELADCWATDMAVAAKSDIGRGQFATFTFGKKEIPVISVRARAKNALGLNETSAKLLFNGDNDLRIIRRYVAILLTGRQLSWNDED